MAAGFASVTLTADIGPGQQITGQVISNVSEINFRFDAGVVDITVEDPPKTLSVEYSNLVTVTINPATNAVVIADA